jgi:hypothetical protein
MELDAILVLGEPLLAGLVEPVAGAVVDDQEDLPPVVLLDQQHQELMERVPVEHRSSPLLSGVRRAGRAPQVSAASR